MLTEILAHSLALVFVYMYELQHQNKVERSCSQKALEMHLMQQKNQNATRSAKTFRNVAKRTAILFTCLHEFTARILFAK